METRKLSGLIAYPGDEILMTPEKAWKMFCFGPIGGTQKKTFKLAEANLPFAKWLVQVDIKMAKRYGEDAIFEANPTVMYNMRRGLSFLMGDIAYRKKLRPEEAQMLQAALEEEKKKLKKERTKKPKKSPALKEKEEVKTVASSTTESLEDEGYVGNKFEDFQQEEEAKIPAATKEQDEREMITEKVKSKIEETKPLLEPAKIKKEEVQKQEELKKSLEELPQPVPEQKVLLVEEAKPLLTEHPPETGAETKPQGVPKPLPQEAASSTIPQEAPVTNYKELAAEKAPLSKEKGELKKQPVFLVSRKGLQKFFDIDVRCFEKGFDLPQRDNKINYLLGPVQQHFYEGNEIEVFATRKANGENAQVAYIPLLDLWCIGSKNVSLCARSSEDLMYYTADSRYSFAREIAAVWFKMVQALKIQGKLEAFKAEAANRTLVGEYVGNYDHQHLVKYEKETILFYAVVDNAGITNCIGPAAAMALFDKYGLDHVSCESVGVYQTMEALLEGIKKTYISICLESLDNEEEGLALYIATKGLPEDYTISLCKVKTLEYRIYRKIRETVKNQIRRSYAPGTMQSQFSKNCAKMISSILACVKNVPDVFRLLPMPYEYYQQVALMAFKMAIKMPVKTDIYIHYVDFIEECMAAVDADILSGFVKKELEESKVVLLITPPFYLSEPTIKKMQGKFNYLTFNDLIKQPMVTQLNEASLVHMYIPPGASKAFSYRIKSLNKAIIIFAGYTKTGISFKAFEEFIEEKRKELAGHMENLNRRDRNYIRMQHQRVVLLHDKAVKNVKGAIHALDEADIHFEFTEERGDDLIKLIEERCAAEKSK